VSAVGAASIATPRVDPKTWSGLLMCSPALTLIALALVAPLCLMLVVSFYGQDGEPSLENYARLLEPLYLHGARETLQAAFVVTLCCVVLGYPLSYYLASLPTRWGNAALLLVLLPFWTSVLVRTYAWLVILQRRGIVNESLQWLGVIDEPLRLINNFAGTVIGMTHVLLPFVVLPLYANMRAISGDYVRAATSLGATPARAFRQVFFPLSIPGLTAGATLAFVMSLGFFVTPALLGGGKVTMWSMHVQSALTIYPHWGAASALGVSLLVVTLALLGAMHAVGKRLAARRTG
jgi:ABC-type spermidine/putrescine transport system permease subunit I